MRVLSRAGTALYAIQRRSDTLDKLGETRVARSLPNLWVFMKMPALIASRVRLFQNSNNRTLPLTCWIVLQANRLL